MNTTNTNSDPSPSQNGKTNNKHTPAKQKRNRNTSNDEMTTESMDYDVIGSPMHMSDWLSTNTSSAPLDDSDALFPSFSSNLSFSNDDTQAPNKPNNKPKPFISNTPKKKNHNMFSTPSDEPWE